MEVDVAPVYGAQSAESVNPSEADHSGDLFALYQPLSFFLNSQGCRVGASECQVIRDWILLQVLSEEFIDIFAKLE